ncbi:pilus (MSHA type) biogenesis protein MshL [Hydrogenovibrio sp. SC-1]|nr:pilus (MSHA type) biogenesis protein MshL [Hydrogenovibrio sp. SC-1]
MSIVLLMGCSGADSVKRESVAPAVAKKFEIKGHLTPEKNLSEQGNIQNKIPELAPMEPMNVDPNQFKMPKLYSVSAINVPVSDLLFNLAKDAGMQLNLASDVTGQVSINAIQQPLDIIMKRVVEQVGAIYSLSFNTVSVQLDKPFWKNYEIDYVNVVKNIKDLTVMKMSVGNVTGTDNNSGNQASEFTLESSATHDFWKSLQKNIASMARLEEYQTKSETADNRLENVVVNKEAGMITVYTTTKKHQQIEAYLQSTLRRTNKQVLIEATVIEVELSDQYQAGVDWGALKSSAQGSSEVAQSLLGTNLSTNPNFSVNVSSLGDWNFNLGIKMLQQFGEATVLSSPKIMAMNNQAALLKVVNNEVYFTVDVNRESATATSSGVTTFETTVHTVPVGFMMHVTPFISEDEISLNIRPTLSRIVGYVSDPNPDLARENVVSQVPVIQEREMDSVLRLRNRQTAIIGGLIQDSNDQTRAGVPGLSRIPWLGDLFSYEDESVRKSELIIFIRPIIVNNPDVNHGDLQAFKPLMRTQSN